MRSPWFFVVIPSVFLAALFWHRHQASPGHAAGENKPLLATIGSSPFSTPAKPWSPTVLDAVPPEFRAEYLRETWRGDPRYEAGTGGAGLADLPASERQEMFQALAPHVDRQAFDQLSPLHTDMVMRISKAIGQEDDPPEICFYQGTDPALVRSIHALVAAARAKGKNPDVIGTQALQLINRWGNTATNGTGLSQGDPTTVTWSIVPDGTPIEGGAFGAGEPASPSNLRARLNAIYGNQAAWFPLFQATLDRVATVAGARLVYEPNDDGSALGETTGVLGVRGDVRIGGHTIDNIAGILAYNFFPNIGDMVIDTSDTIILSTGAVANNSLLLRNTIAHENGHGMGLLHVCPVNRTKLLEPFLTNQIDGLQFDDIFSLNRHYGDPNEPNDAFGTAATNLGTINPATGHQSGLLSIDDGTDVDDFRFQFPQAGHDIIIKATPVAPAASPYREGAQDSISGACTLGTDFDATSRNDLFVALYDANGTLVQQVDLAPVGQVETAIIPLLGAAGATYYVRVDGAASSASQMYQLDLSFPLSVPHVAAANATLVAEQCIPANGAADPDEIVTMDFTIKNSGAYAINNLQVTLNASSNILAPSAPQTISLAVGASAPARFTFRAGGSCGDLITASLSCREGTADLETLAYDMRLGTTVVETENFDAVAVPNLPANWSQSLIPGGTPNVPANWRTRNTGADSAPNVAFVPNVIPVNGTGNHIDSVLLSRPYTIVSTLPRLSFRHRYQIEERYDGAVLEMEVDGGLWTGIEGAGGLFLAGAYDTNMRADTATPLANLRAWTGDSQGYRTTTVALPESVVGHTVRFRWRLVCDPSIVVDGWYLDNVQVTTGYQCASCDSPTVTLNVTDGAAVEPAAGEGPDKARLRFTRSGGTGGTTFALPVAYTIGGTAMNGTDFTPISGQAIIPIGSNEAVLDIVALADNAIENPETVSITLANSITYTVGTSNPGTITIVNTGGSLPGVYLSADLPMAEERSAAGGVTAGLFVLRRAEATVGNLTLLYSITGNATNGVDFVSIPSQHTFTNQSRRNLSITPLLDPLPEGNETVTLALLANAAYSIQSLPATVTIKDRPLDAWRFAQLVGRTGLTGDGDDPDNDRLPNIVEYAFGLEPLAMNDHYCEATKEVLGGTNFLMLDYRIPAGITDILHVGESSTDLTSWTMSGVQASQVETTAEFTTHRLRAAVEPDERKFLHVKVSRAP